MRTLIVEREDARARNYAEQLRDIMHVRTKVEAREALAKHKFDQVCMSGILLRPEEAQYWLQRA